jgi:hypothetical protein
MKGENIVVNGHKAASSTGMREVVASALCSGSASLRPANIAGSEPLPSGRFPVDSRQDREYLVIRSEVSP